jgi:hypothetical protein
MCAGVKCESIFKISEGRPNPSDYLKNGEITMMMITSSGDEPDLRDGKDLRRLALTLQARGSKVERKHGSRQDAPDTHASHSRLAQHVSVCAFLPTRSPSCCLSRCQHV